MTGENKLAAVRERKTWFEARERCLRDGGDLFYQKPNEELSEMLRSALEDAWLISGDLVHVGLVRRIWKFTSNYFVIGSVEISF